MKGEKIKNDQWAALALLQIISFFFLPLWKAVLVIPGMILFVLPFWFLEKISLDRLREGKSTFWVTASIYGLALAIFVGLSYLEYTRQVIYAKELGLK